MFEPVKDRPNLSSSWNLANYWFRLLEMGLILGTLGYLKTKTEYLPLSMLYWISWAILFGWLIDLTDSLALIFFENKTIKRKWIIWLISYCLVFGLFLIISGITEYIIKQQVGKV